MSVRLGADEPQVLSDVQLRQPGFLLLTLSLDVSLHETRKGNGTTRSDEPGNSDLCLRAQGNLPVEFGVDLDADGLALGVGHLGGDRALPDQLVKAELIGSKPGLRRGTEVGPSGTNRLVGLLRVLHLAGIETRLLGHILAAIQLDGLVARRVNSLAGKRNRVGTHIRDETGFVQLLGYAHGSVGAETEFAARLLLKCGGPERSRRPAPVRLVLDVCHRDIGLL